MFIYTFILLLAVNLIVQFDIQFEMKFFTRFWMLLAVFIIECAKIARTQRALPENGVLGPVQAMSLISTVNSIFIDWRRPNNSLNLELTYKIIYWTTGKNFPFCSLYPISKKEVIAAFTHHNLTSLMPYSRYHITIQAASSNASMRSETISMTVVTKGITNLEVYEYNKVAIVLKKVLWETAIFEIQAFDCKKVEGEIKVKLILSCQDKSMCPKEKIYDLNSLTLSYDALWKPMNEYKYEGSLCRFSRCTNISSGAFEANTTALEAPMKLRVEWFENSTIQLLWHYPRKFDSNLTFEITIIEKRKSLDTKHYTKHGEGRYSRYFLKVPEIFPDAIDIRIKIVANSFSQKSSPAIMETSSFPPVPNWMDHNGISIQQGITTITVTINFTKSTEHSLLKHSFLILINGDETDAVDESNLRKVESYLNITFDRQMQSRVVAQILLLPDNNQQLRYTIGNGTSTSMNWTIKELSNRALKINRKYTITILLVSEFKLKFRHRKFYLYSSTSPSEISENTYGISIYTLLYVLIIISICAVCMISGVLVYRKRMQRTLISMNTNLYVNVRGSVPSSPNRETAPDESFNAVPTNVSSSGPVYSEAVSIANFEEYVRVSVSTGELERQYNLLCPDQAEDSGSNSSLINDTNNIYLDLLACDHARVKLKNLPGDKQYSYINASYINGYKTTRAYIATQNPRTENFENFWRMIWQENVKHIFMLTNIHGGEKEDVEPFWPNINEELNFRNISVKNSNSTISADFECRTFNVRSNKEERKVKKTMFTSWPCNDIPFYPQSLLPLIRELLKIPLRSTSPVVVQCSNGVGKTGTILLIDISLRMASESGYVDILGNFQKLRNQKPNMVDNVEQYKLAYLAVLQLQTGIQTSIPCSHMNEMAAKIIDGEEYKIHMDYVKKIEWQNRAMEKIQEYTEIFVNYPEKNRIQNIFPGDHGRIFLEKYPKNNASSSYINAVQVDAYKCPGRYIVTQQPMPNTLGDFWRLIVEKNVNIIISLNEVDMDNETSCIFLPTMDNSVLRPVDYILVSLEEVVRMQNYDIHSLLVKNRNKAETINVEVLAFKKWPANKLLPSTCEEFLSFWEEADNMSKRSRHIVVTCFDGVTASGVFVALTFIIERMKAEQKCDVCLAVQAVRQNRNQFVTEESQFVFLFVAAIRFINGFQSYSNFQHN